MGNDTLSFSNILLSQTGKKGVLKELDGGYYEIMLGAFGTNGNGGWIYNTESAMRYVKSDREFMYMLNSGRLRSEWGHPVREPGMSDAEWFTRINTIYEPNTSSHIRKIDFSANLVRDAKGRSVVAIIGQVRPSGKNSQEFKEQLENPHEDVNYSVRSFARRDFRNMNKHITKIVTWDNVFDPGIKVASKYHTPSLESSRIDFEDPNQVASMLDSYEFNVNQLKDEVPSMDSMGSFESHSDIITVIDHLVEKNSTSVHIPQRSKFLGI